MSKTLTRAKRQLGFTLIEILVALAILSVIALLASAAFDGSRSKAQAMISLARQVSDANITLKNDTGCYVKNPKALFDVDAAQEAANNYCGRVFGNTWSRPYLAQYPVDSNGLLKIDKIAAEVTLGFATATSATNNRKQYYIHIANVPKDVIKQALVECNNDDTAQGDFASARCRTTTDLSADAPGDFDVLYDTTR